MDLEINPELVERTLALAEKGWGMTHPNPMVGALIVENGEVVAEGYHAKAGSPHAEINAFSSLGRKPKDGAVLYISLEPCSTTGRTPPCTSAILDSGIQDVVIGCIDPDSRHGGRGIEMLREHGVAVHQAQPALEKKAIRLNMIFNHWAQSKTPLIALKMALSANGMVAERAGYPSRVTGEIARADVMRWRRLFPAICVGSGTVIADNPALTARLPEEDWCPVRLVLDSSLLTFSDEFHPRHIYTDQYSDKTVVITTSRGLENKEAVGKAHSLGIRIMKCGGEEDGRVSPRDFRKTVLELGLHGVYCEGGPAVARALLAANEVDYLFHYRSSREFNSPEAMIGPDLQSLVVREPLRVDLGADHLIHGYL
jgi:diaminohydroxyphosphoribosylaminopyrimidine deaminase/5-amino-6-(5-phosphoribosylamino)uracil reductase